MDKKFVRHQPAFGRSVLKCRAVMEDFPDLSAHQVYACGVPIMVDSARRDFVQQCKLPELEFFADRVNYFGETNVSRPKIRADLLRYDRQWPQYGFAEHKGYGTERHLAALAEHGPCALHRRSFAPMKPKAPPVPDLFHAVMDSPALVPEQRTTV